MPILKVSLNLLIDSLNFHLEYCNQHDVVKLVLPKDGEKLSFEHFNRSMKVPMIVYADLEAFTKPIDTCQPNPEKSYTEQYQKHNSKLVLLLYKMF